MLVSSLYLFSCIVSVGLPNTRIRATIPLSSYVGICFIKVLCGTPHKRLPYLMPFPSNVLHCHHVYDQSAKVLY